MSDRFKPVLAGEPVGFFHPWRIGKPQGVLPAVIQAKDRAQLLLHVISRAQAQRSPGAAFLVGKMDRKALGILVAHPRLCELRIRPRTKARHVPCEHVIVAFAIDDPLRGHQTHAARLAEPRNDPVAAKVVPQVRMRAIKNIAVGRPDHRAVDHPFDPGFADGWHPRDGAHHVFFDPFQIIGKELMSKPRRGAVLGPETHVLFIGANQ